VKAAQLHIDHPVLNGNQEKARLTLGKIFTDFGEALMPVNPKNKLGPLTKEQYNQ
jgi:hypothetical protein